LLFKGLLFSRELLYIHINVPPNTLTVQTAKNHKEIAFLPKRKLCHGRCVVTYGKKRKEREKLEIQDAVFSKRRTLPPGLETGEKIYF